LYQPRCEENLIRNDENGRGRRASEVGQALSPANRLFRAIQTEPTAGAAIFESVLPSP
jgi:hypothetical protein